MRHLLIALIPALLLSFAGCAVSGSSPPSGIAPAHDHPPSSVEEAPPNVILILADDMALGDIGRFNDGRSTTPALDRLAGESVLFSQAYSASPVCAPARAALLTGRYPHRTGVVTLSPKRFPELNRLMKDEVTIANLFGANGYATGMVGKWHTGIGEEYHPLARGFDEFVGATFMARDVPSYYDYTLDVQGTPQKFEDTYLTHEFTRRAIDFVRRHKDEPFFLHLAHYAPHRPLEAPWDIVDRYIERGFDENTATIYAMIEVMDDGIGQLLNEIETLGLRDNTIVIFASDNGPDPITGARFNHDLRGTKYTAYEGGIRVPFFLRWPAHFSPGEREAIIHFTDVVPTLVDLCDLDTPEGLQLDGSNLADVLNGTVDDVARPRYWQWNRGVPYYTHNAAIREGAWKLVRPYVTRELVTEESTAEPVLYNLDDDPFEEHDRSADHPEIHERMNAALEAWNNDIERDRRRHE